VSSRRACEDAEASGAFSSRLVLLTPRLLVQLGTRVHVLSAHVHTCTCTGSHTRPHACTCTSTHSRAPVINSFCVSCGTVFLTPSACMLTHTHTRMHTNTHAHAHARMRAHIPVMNFLAFSSRAVFLTPSTRTMRAVRHCVAPLRTSHAGAASAAMHACARH